MPEPFMRRILAWPRQALWRWRARRPSRARIRVHEFVRRVPEAEVAAPGSAPRERTICTLCTHRELDSPAFRGWIGRLGEAWSPHRKLWELAYICETLHQRGMLAPGRRGLGFAVGAERLPSFFAAQGCDIVASDLPADDDRTGRWAASGQWSADVAALNRFGLCPDDAFRRLVSFRPVDMNHIPDDLRDFDFTWSTCSFEHCGTLALGLRFLERQMHCLKPGGVAVHTTEFNLSSNRRTRTRGAYVLYRMRDMEDICTRLRAAGHHVEPLDLDPGDHELDRYVDRKPFSSGRHLRLDLRGFAATSIGLIIRKAA